MGLGSRVLIAAFDSRFEVCVFAGPLFLCLILQVFLLHIVADICFGRFRVGLFGGVGRWSGAGRACPPSA